MSARKSSLRASSDSPPEFSAPSGSASGDLALELRAREVLRELLLEDRLGGLE